MSQKYAKKVTKANSLAKWRHQECLQILEKIVLNSDFLPNVFLNNLIELYNEGKFLKMYLFLYLPIRENINCQLKYFMSKVSLGKNEKMTRKS